MTDGPFFDHLRNLFQSNKFVFKRLFCCTKLESDDQWTMGALICFFWGQLIQKHARISGEIGFRSLRVNQSRPHWHPIFHRKSFIFRKRPKKFFFETNSFDLSRRGPIDSKWYMALWIYVRFASILRAFQVIFWSISGSI